MGEPKARFTLGWHYEHGIGVEKDMGEAKRLYQLAVEQGHAQAQKDLARLAGLAAR